MKPTCRNAKPEGPGTGRLSVDLWQDTSGAVALEYGLIAALIAVVLIGSLIQLGEAVFGLPLQSLIDVFVDALS